MQLPDFLIFFSVIIYKLNIGLLNIVSCLFQIAIISVHICIASQPTKSARLLFTYSTHNVQVHNKLDIKIPTVHV